jgi:outer membrane protein OmpA-like peptidoglycan-associated protein
MKLFGRRLPLLLSTAVVAWCQPGPVSANDPQPIYRVTVVSRTLPAVNYEHRSGPTQIDFRGTVLLPAAKGSAIVESKRGRIEIDAKFEHLDPPTRYGREYLTYVLWAITPEGRAKNLGELLANSSNKAKITVTSDLQALGLMVTAEPYYAVTTPSDVVVLENVIRPDTAGRTEPVTVKYDLLPRGQYTLHVKPEGLQSADMPQEKLSYDRYEAVLELYQAQNAIQIARSAGADRFAQDSISKADALLAEAQHMQALKQDTHLIVSRAREAAQMAEDARVIAVKRGEEEKISREREREEHQARVKAEETRRSEEEAATARAAADRERAELARAAAQAEMDRSIAVQRRVQSGPAQAPQVQRVPTSTPPADSPQRQTRAQLLGRLRSILPTRDTPRGLVITVSDSSFETGHGTLRPEVSDRLARLASLLSSRRDLTIAVEGFTDDHGSVAEQRTVSQRRAQEVRAALVLHGLPPEAVDAAGMGGEHPVMSNATNGGREQNRRVEIVISSPSIGNMALWDRPYALGSQH